MSALLKVTSALADSQSSTDYNFSFERSANMATALIMNAMLESWIWRKDETQYYDVNTCFNVLRMTKISGQQSDDTVLTLKECLALINFFEALSVKNTLSVSCKSILFLCI